MLATKLSVFVFVFGLLYCSAFLTLLVLAALRSHFCFLFLILVSVFPCCLVVWFLTFCLWPDYLSALPSGYCSPIVDHAVYLSTPLPCPICTCLSFVRPCLCFWPCLAIKACIWIRTPLVLSAPLQRGDGEILIIWISFNDRLQVRLSIIFIKQMSSVASLQLDISIEHAWYLCTPDTFLYSV